MPREFNAQPGKVEAVLASVPLDRPVSVVKIDAEGHEPQVLRGMEKVLRTSPGIRVACEISPQSYPVADLCAYLSSLGFQGEYYRVGQWHRITPDHLPDILCNAWFWRQ